MKSETKYSIIIFIVMMGIITIIGYMFLGNYYGTYPRYNTTITIKEYIGSTSKGVLAIDGRGFKQNIGVHLEIGKTYDVAYYVDPKYQERWIMQYIENISFGHTSRCNIYVEGSCI